MCQHRQFLRPASSGYGFAGVVLVMLLSVFGLNAEAGESLPSVTPDFSSILQSHADRMAKLESEKDALNLFVTTIGPAIQLNDAAQALSAKALPAKLVQELLIPDLTAATHRLMASLAAWHLAFSVRQSVNDQLHTVIRERLSGKAPLLIWLNQQEHISWH
ncbi:MAG: hypothetical protein OEV08_07675, partial [Nitrospira sp.]|nr:hypothetical protein [Nitrospira sp.]